MTEPNQPSQVFPSLVPNFLIQPGPNFMTVKADEQKPQVTDGPKRKILMLSDHPLSTSGVGVQARWLIQGLIQTGKWKFRCFGGAVKHEKYDTIKVSDDLVIKPTNGFGDKNLMRMTLAAEQPDVLLLFTDPRFFIWIWEMEDEVHQICPIAYNHLWDNPPWPEFNRVLYESTDLVNCINWPTYDMVHQRFPEKTNYIPHAVPKEVFFPLTADERVRLRTMILGKERVDHFVALYVSRNARRKMPSDIILSFKMFLDQMEKNHGHRKGTLVLHTDPMDPEGPNLHHVIDMFHMKDHTVFSKDRIGFEQMNALYNCGDTIINRSCNEGFGLPTLEMMMAGKPIIALKTGGLTRQVEDSETGEQYGIGIDPEVRTLVGNQMVPYIYEDFISHETLANALTKMYEMGPEERERIGKRARAHAMKDYDINRLIKDWDTSLTDLCDKWQKTGRTRWEKLEI
jgi:glycosyltransferase involved in cell wall biosynthesis